jgi:hypothetical protein
MKVFGKIYDSTGESIPLANVTILKDGKLTKIGTYADYDGNFTLDDNSITPETVLRLSYVGYIPKDIKASDLQGKNVKLLQDVEVLQEVTVFGQPKAKITQTKNKFISHLQDHKTTYATIGGLLGLLLIGLSIKKLK